MTPYSDNDLVVSSATYTDSQQLIAEQPSRKLTLQVEGAAIYYQILDRVQGAFSNAGPEIKLLPGFASITFASAIYGFRWRKAAAAVSDPILSYVYYV